MLNGVLGEYVHGISTRDLNVAVFKGDIVLKGMRLKVEALNALGLPFRVLSGVVGKLTLQIPWRALGKQPVVVRIEELYVVAGFAEPDAELTVEERTARWEAAQAALKRRLVDEGEANWLAASDAPDASDASTTPADASASTSGSGDGWLAGMLDTILGNLEVTVSRIHLRLEGDLAAPDPPRAPTPSRSASPSRPSPCTPSTRTATRRSRPRAWPSACANPPRSSVSPRTSTSAPTPFDPRRPPRGTTSPPPNSPR